MKLENLDVYNIEDHSSSFYSSTQQKQIDCFNHMSGYIGYRLAGEMVVMRSSFLVLETNCKRQSERQLSSLSYNQNKSHESPYQVLQVVCVSERAMKSKVRMIKSLSS